MMGSVVVFLVVVMRQLAMPPTSSSSTITTMTTTTNGDVSKAGNGYINLSCPYEMSKFSCAYMITHDEKDGSCSDGSRAQETLDASTEYYLQNMDMIQSIFRLAEARGKEQGPRRIFFTGDSLMRQIFIAIACNAMSSLPQGVDLIEHAVFPWKDAWPTNSIGPCLKTGGQHSGFDAASIRLTNKLEIHWVPHTGYMDSNTAEHEVLERLRQDIIDHNGRITFGTKTAVPLPPDTHVDVLVYNNGMYICENIYSFSPHRRCRRLHSLPSSSIPSDLPFAADFFFATASDTFLRYSSPIGGDKRENKLFY